ncbi:hypothetical protein CBS147343_7457 [Aspergillus niger]|nr:hypothetical protein CBS147343_7457 [Aspergillus niger]
MATFSLTGGLASDLTLTDSNNAEAYNELLGQGGIQLDDFFAAPVGSTGNIQTFSQDLPSTFIAQDVGEDGGFDPFVMGMNMDPVWPMTSFGSEPSLFASIHDGALPAMDDNQTNPIDNVGSFDQTAAANNMEPSTTGQSNSTAVQSGSMPENQTMVGLQGPEALGLASTMFARGRAPISVPMNGVQQNTLKQTRETLPMGFSPMDFFGFAGTAVNNSGASYDNDEANEAFLNIGNNLLRNAENNNNNNNNYVNNASSNYANNASNNLVENALENALDNQVDSASRGSYNSTPTEQAASTFGNVIGKQNGSSDGSQKSTPPSQPVHAAGGPQGPVMPTIQVDRNRSNSGSSRNSGTSQRCKASSPVDQITGNTGSENTGNQITGHQIFGSQVAGHQITGNHGIGFTPQQGTQACQGIFSSQQVASQNNRVIRSSPESGSGPMNSSPPDYLPGQLGTAEEFNQDGSSGGSGFSVQQNTHSHAYHLAAVQSEATIPVDMSGQPVVTAPAPVHNLQPSFVPLIEQLMNPEVYNIDCSTLYASVEEARAARPVQDGVREDTTLPTNDLQKQAIVRALTKAMFSTQNAEDNPGMIKPFKEGKYSAERVECVCWEILDCVITRQISGSLLAVHGLKKKITSDLMTFAEHAPYMHQFVDDPQAAYKRVIANKTLNKRKGEVMNAGKQVLGAKKAAESNAISQSVKVAAPAMPTASTMPSMANVPAVTNAGVAMTPNNNPGSIAATGRNPPPATPTHMTQPVNLMAPANRARYQMPMSAGTPTPVNQVRLGPVQYHSAPLNRIAAAQAYHNRMMGGPTSHPRTNAGSVTMPPTTQASPSPYDPEQTLNNLLLRNLMANQNQVAPETMSYPQMGYQSRMVNPHHMGSQPQMGHQTHMGPQTQVPGTGSGTRKRRREESDAEDTSPSAKRQH